MSRSSRLDETGSRVLKHCKLQYEINLFGLRSPLGPSWAPGPSSIVQAMWPKMVFGHNLQHIAPFGIPTSGFCMVFQYGSLIFSTPGPILGPQDLDLGSGWAGDLFWTKRGGGGKQVFVEEMVPHEVLWESVRGDWIVWYPGGLWAGLFPPKPS